MTTYIYVDRTAIERNREDGGKRPPLIISRNYQEINVNRIKIIGECELIYNPLTSPIPGAVVFLEVPASSKVKIINPDIGDQSSDQ